QSMQNNEIINFRKERELGDIITDSFKFIRQNYKILSKILLKIVGPVMLLFVLSYTAYNYLILDGSTGFFDVQMEKHVEELISQFAVTTLLGMLFMLVITFLFYGLFYAAINFSIQSYIENNGEIIL